MSNKKELQENDIEFSSAEFTDVADELEKLELSKKDKATLMRLYELYKKKKDEEGAETEHREVNKDLDRELQEALNQLGGVLSAETRAAIKGNPQKMREIIEGLRKKGVEKEQGIGLARVKTLKRGRGGPSLG